MSGLSWIPVERRTIQLRNTVLSPETCPVYRVFRSNSVWYSETYLYVHVYIYEMWMFTIIVNVVHV